MYKGTFYQLKTLVGNGIVGDLVGKYVPNSSTGIVSYSCSNLEGRQRSLFKFCFDILSSIGNYFYIICFRLLVIFIIFNEVAVVIMIVLDEI